MQQGGDEHMRDDADGDERKDVGGDDDGTAAAAAVDLTAKDMLAAGRDQFNRREVLEILGEAPLDYPELGSRLLEAMANFTPTIPEQVLDAILARSGFRTTDPKL
eukprot:TRINITY_DN7709_c0_g2_i2.p1 TRINITY_DN7709_c0_g2~~TRINITY_DN7709_c0_g2_i2.p1  ORF type:complete len:105 (-),score=29.74 TRINITY_DN7709_c0_g2_i2:56-370(-)